ncbi:MAG: anaerobic sulfatase maturase [Acidobacteriota bacterium]|nr:anaerobic sulfatase maturase [Acidobacteriota bacterium]
MRSVSPEYLAMPATSFHVMTKPIGPICNLDCSYCFYLEKEKLYPGTKHWAMQLDVLERSIVEYIASQPQPELHFAWQGGEPTLLGVEFFRTVVALQRKHAAGRSIHNALQTNATLLDDGWGEFLAAEKFLVGVSVDGPRELHDTYRVDKGGAPTFDKVMRGLRVLQRHGVPFNTLTVVNRSNAAHPAEVYRFLREEGSRFLQFIPVVERRASTAQANGLVLIQPDDNSEAVVTEWSVQPLQYGEFLVGVFEEWVVRDVGQVFVQQFDVALESWVGMPSSLCVFRETCGSALAMEHSGDVYSCDHYVYPEHRLGNVMQQSLEAMAASPQQQRFGNAKRDTLPRMCRSCEVRFACHGECPKHRFLTTPEGEPGLNYLCAGYKHFFNHIDPYMRLMAAELQAGRPPANVMRIARGEG